MTKTSTRCRHAHEAFGTTLTSVEQKTRTPMALVSTEETKRRDPPVRLPPVNHAVCDASIGALYDAHVKSQREQGDDRAPTTLMSPMFTVWSSYPLLSVGPPQGGAPGSAPDSQAIDGHRAALDTPSRVLATTSLDTEPPPRRQGSATRTLDDRFDGQKDAGVPHRQSAARVVRSHLIMEKPASSHTTERVKALPAPPVVPKPCTALRRFDSVADAYDYGAQSFVAQPPAADVPPPTRTDTVKGLGAPLHDEWASFHADTVDTRPGISGYRLDLFAANCTTAGIHNSEPPDGVRPGDAEVFPAQASVRVSATLAKDEDVNGTSTDAASSARSLHRTLSLAAFLTDFSTSVADEPSCAADVLSSEAASTLPAAAVPSPKSGTSAQSRLLRLAEVRAAVAQGTQDSGQRSYRSRKPAASHYIAFEQTMPAPSPQPDPDALTPTPPHADQVLFDFAKLHNWKLSDAQWVDSPRGLV